VGAGFDAAEATCPRYEHARTEAIPRPPAKCGFRSSCEHAAVRSAVISSLALALALAGCGEKGEPQVTAPRTAATATGAADSPQAGAGAAEGAGNDSDRDSDPAARAAARRRAVERVVRAYLQGLDARNGAAVCRRLAAQVLEEIDLPRERSSCAASLDASIGYRDPRGLPQFAGVQLAQLVSTQADRRRARVTATVVTRFADRDEPSIEDDIVYLERVGADWLIAKPDAALYRAVGAEPSVRSIVPPG
jgi:plasmid stability protein